MRLVSDLDVELDFWVSFFNFIVFNISIEGFGGIMFFVSSFYWNYSISFSFLNFILFIKGV